MAVYGRIRLIAPPPPTIDEALLIVFRSTMQFYVTHREIKMLPIVTATLIAMRESVDEQLASQIATLRVGCAVIQRYSAIRDESVITAIALAHRSIQVYQA